MLRQWHSPIHVEEGGKAQVGHPILTVETESGGNVVEVEEPAVAGEAKGEESVTSEDSYLEAAPVADELEPEPRGPDSLPTEAVPRDIAPESPSVRRFAR